MQSAPPSVNYKLGLEGRYDASPGSTRVISPAEAAATAAAAKAKAAAATAAAAESRRYLSLDAAGRSNLHQRSYVRWRWHTATVD